MTILLFCCTTLHAQQPSGYTIEQLLQQLDAADDTETESWESIYDVVCDIAENPINLNTATKEDLQRLPFLTNQQIEDIQAYLYQYGDMQSMGELAMISSLDEVRMELLRHCSYISTTNSQGFPSWSTIAKYGKHNATLTGKIPFYKRKGDDNGYLGYPYRHSLRYSYGYGDYLKVGLTAAQDAGEPFFKGGNGMGYDHYSYYLVIRKLGRLKNLTLGHYKLRTGMGLVANNDIAFGKTMLLPTLLRPTATLRPYASRSSANYLQGAAATVEIVKHLDVTPFVSYRYIDATLRTDIPDAIATIVKSGYHRTPTEMKKKHNASMTNAGMHMEWKNNGFHLGATGLYTHLSMPLKPKTQQDYRRYSASGDSFWNASMDYGYTSNRLTVSGETAINDQHAIATANAASLRLSGAWQVTALQRFYSYRYYSLLANSFSDGGSVQNESGLYVGAEWRPSRRLAVSAYADVAHFPWKKYQADQSSNAWDANLAASYTTKPLTLSLHYRYRTKQKNNQQKTALTDDATHRLRLAAAWHHGAWSTLTQGYMAINDYKQSSRGWMASQQVAWQHRGTLQIAAHIAWFHTDDYASRIYSFERGPMYEFYFPAFYGEGIRYSLLAKATLSAKVSLLARMATTNYFDRDHISSGLQQIDHSSMTDLELQLRLRL